MPLLAWFILILWRVLSWTGFILLLITLGLWWHSYRGGFDIAHTFDNGVNQPTPTVRVAIGSSNGRLLITSEENNDGFEDDLSVDPRSSNPWLIISANELATRFNWTPRHSQAQKTFLGYGHERRTVRTPGFEPRGAPNPSRRVREIRTDDIVIPYALCASSFTLWPLSNLLIWVKRKRQGRCPQCGGRRDRQGSCTLCSRTASGRPRIAARTVVALGKLSFVLLLLTAATAVLAWFSADRIEIQSFIEDDPGGRESRATSYYSIGLTRPGLELFNRRIHWEDAAELQSWPLGMTRVFLAPGPDVNREAATEHFSLLGLTIDRMVMSQPVASPTFIAERRTQRPLVRSPLVIFPPSSWTNLVIPWWFVLTLFTLFSTPWLLTLHRRRRGRLRKRRGQCPACGYDLRATPGHCPECGDGTPSKKSSA